MRSLPVRDSVARRCHFSCDAALTVELAFQEPIVAEIATVGQRGEHERYDHASIVSRGRRIIHLVPGWRHSLRLKREAAIVARMGHSHRVCRLSTQIGGSDPQHSVGPTGSFVDVGDQAHQQVSTDVAVGGHVVLCS